MLLLFLLLVVVVSLIIITTIIVIIIVLLFHVDLIVLFFTFCNFVDFIFLYRHLKVKCFWF